MIRYNFTNVSRERLAKIAQDVITALADKRKFDKFTLTLDMDGDESDIEVIKNPRFGCDSELKINDEMDDVSDEAKDAAKKLMEAK